MQKKTLKICAVLFGALAVACLIGLAVTGWKIGWGPFAGLYDWDSETLPLAQKHVAAEHQHEIVFYGASNFRLWAQMEGDLSDYKVLNHGFGGSTDRLLMEYADLLVYPYEPDIVFFQTGSNDYANQTGTDAQIVADCMAYKKEMFAAFHARLPEAKLVVMSGLLLPGRSAYTAMTQQINAELSKLCEETDYLYFVNAEDMTYTAGAYVQTLFEGDGIHLNREGQLLWCEQYIRPQIESLVIEFKLDHLRKGS